MLRFIIGLLAALASSAVLAYSSTSTGNATTFRPKVIGSGNVGAHAVSYASDGTVLFKSAERMPLAGGGSIPVDVSGGVSRPNVARALGRFAMKATGIVGILGTGVALWELAQELGFDLDNSSGSLVVKEQNPEACSSNCYTYTALHGGTTPISEGSLAGFCSTYVALSVGHYNTNQTNYLPTLQALDVPNQRCYIKEVHRITGSTSYIYVTPTRTPRAPDADPWMSSNVDAFVDALTGQTTWGPSSKIAEATADAIRAGDALEATPQVITGPATSPGPVTTTVNVTDNTTTTSTTTHNHTYEGDKVTTTTTTNIVTRDNTTNDIVDEKTITSQPTMPEAPEFKPPCGIAGLPPCNVKVDETGVPSDGAPRFETAKTDLDKVQTDANTAFGDHEDISLPEWSWTFQFPTGCSPLVLSAFNNLAIDVCQWQPIIHDLMSMLWVAAGIFGLIALFRNATGV